MALGPSRETSLLRGHSKDMLGDWMELVFVREMLIVSPQYAPLLIHTVGYGLKIFWIRQSYESSPSPGWASEHFAACVLGSGLCSPARLTVH